MVFDKELRNADNWRLYHLLELEPPVTAKQVQWLFRKVTLRHHFYQAYNILRDEERKSLYDSLGENFVGYLNSGSWGPLIQLLGAKATVAVCCGVWVLMILLMLFFFLAVGARADRLITWTWMQVAAPGLTVTLIVLIATAVAMAVSFFLRQPKEEGMRFVDRIPAIGNFVAAFFYCIFAFIGASTVDSYAPQRHNNYAPYFALPILADVIYYLSTMVWRWPRNRRLDLEVGMQESKPILWYAPCVFAGLHIILSIVQWVLLAQRVDRIIKISWYAAASPIAVRAVVRVAESCMTSLARRAIGIKSVLGVVFDTLGSLFFNGLLLCSVFFTAARFVRGRRVVPLILVFLPVYLVLFYLLFCTIYTLFYLLRRITENAREERMNNLKWTPVEPQAGDKVVPTLLRDFDASERIIWDDIDDESTMQYSTGYDEVTFETEGYDDYETGEEEEEEEEEELFARGAMVSGSSAPQTAPAHQRNVPLSRQESELVIDDDHSVVTIESSEEQPVRRHHAYHDPYESRTGTGLVGPQSETEYTQYDTNNDAYEVGDTNLESECASSDTSSSFEASGTAHSERHQDPPSENVRRN
ncbi:hypothetical protein, conserved [Trypanosoma brucei brucei TREU927]|uniref:J domain-containing protein n=1 Tax=Trypanosoma brucei brucei (strain 927/4 GUTat10.1) TaxID=185431 RepID=Q38A91_TRYB2|nr:hypothetical protein, conserved [Trypanosoma brucei brucei TREU927]EAN78279.1 hypothetical protein, conserved [Trypanosoma brucei brucei TREU927]